MGTGGTVAAAVVVAAAGAGAELAALVAGLEAAGPQARVREHCNLKLAGTVGRAAEPKYM